MPTPESRAQGLGVLLLASLLLALPWLQGGRAPAGQAALVLLLVVGSVGILLNGSPLIQPSSKLALGTAFALAAASQTVYPDRTVYALLLLLAYVLAAALAARAATGISWAEPAVLASLVVSGLLVAGAAGWTWMRGGDGGLYSSLLVGPFGYPNATAGFLLLATGAAATLARSRSGWLRTCALSAAILLFAGMALTHSRAALLAAGIALTLWAAIEKAVWRHGVGRTAAAIGLLILVPVAAVLLRDSFAAVVAGSPESSAGWRLHMLRWTRDLIFSYPWLGVGPGAFPVAIKYTQQIPYVSGENPHNAYLEIAAEYGIPAALFTLTLLIWFAARLLRAIREARAPGEGNQSLPLLFATLTAFAVHAGLDTLTAFPAIPLAAATLGGLAVGRAGLVRASSRSITWRVSLLLILCIAGLTGAARFFAASELDLGRLALVHGDPAAAVPQLRRALAVNPLSLGVRLSLAQALGMQRKDSEAVQVLEAGVRVAPRDPDTLFIAGETSAAAGNWGVASARFREALELAPATRLRYYAGMIDSMVRTGRPTEALRWFEQAERLFTLERMQGEGRCLEPGDRYLLAKMSRLAARLYAEVPAPDRERAAALRAVTLAQPEVKGICATRGSPGQTSPEAAISTYWTRLAESGWTGAVPLLLPAVRNDVPNRHLAPKGEVKWIAGLSGNEHRVRLQYEVDLEVTGGPAPRCALTELQFSADGWFLEQIPHLATDPCPR